MVVRKIVFLAACLVLGTAYTVQPLQDFPILDDLPRVVPYKEGQTFSVRCIVIGRLGDEARFSWLKNGQPFQIDHETVTAPEPPSTLIFIDPTNSSSPEGIYQCTAKTAVGTATSAPIHVKRYFFDAPEVEVKSHTPIEGDPFELDCPEVKAYPKPRILWMKKYNNSEEFQKVNDIRYTIAPNGKLLFSNITDVDSGKDFKYVCMATSLGLDLVPLAEHYIQDIRDKKESKHPQPWHEPQYVSRDMVTQLGETTKLYCIYGGTPLAQVRWYFNDTELTKLNERVHPHKNSSGNILLIKDTRETDHGTYHCRHTDSRGVTSFGINVTVLNPPSFAQTLEPKISVKEGRNVSVPCQVEGIPKPTISWTYNAHALKSNERISTVLTEHASKIQIKHVQKSDQGFYGCTATNDHGFVYAESYLSVI